MPVAFFWLLNGFLHRTFLCILRLRLLVHPSISDILIFRNKIFIVGLSDSALAELSNKSEAYLYRAVINLLLSNKHGKNALQYLADYYFLRYDTSNVKTYAIDNVKNSVVRNFESRITKEAIEGTAKFETNLFHTSLVQKGMVIKY